MAGLHKRRRQGGVGAGSLSLQSLKTVTSNKYQASEGGSLGRRIHFCEIYIKAQSPKERRGKEQEKKRTEREEAGKNWCGGALFLGVA